LNSINPFLLNERKNRSLSFGILTFFLSGACLDFFPTLVSGFFIIFICWCSFLERRGVFFFLQQQVCLSAWFSDVTRDFPTHYSVQDRFCGQTALCCSAHLCCLLSPLSFLFFFPGFCWLAFNVFCLVLLPTVDDIMFCVLLFVARAFSLCDFVLELLCDSPAPPNLGDKFICVRALEFLHYAFPCLRRIVFLGCSAGLSGYPPW